MHMAECFDLMGFLDGSAVAPSPTITSEAGLHSPNTAYTTWKMKDRKLLSVLYTSLSEDVASEVIDSSTSREDNRVTFNYFQDPRDLQRCVQGMDIIRRVIESRSFAPFRYHFATFQSQINFMLSMPINLRQKHFGSTYSMEQFCIDTVMTIWHYNGGCQVNRVVDRDYRVLGVDALRVIDGSTFYNSPGTNSKATVMMLGR
ncbi:protein HOTHEAD-like [Dorcoceras hygrometricum]|uniref:Protein HOTHEAD-like n=1 Tax=Dorcoceras hygrometricum TaxID=472368 RepID=A0A2Z7DD32_9LAMI|nr:protein HOTHEAD-like [Dorcoceras hygrometricum]